MAKVLVSESNLTNIANAIRTKNGSSDTYTPAQMATAISNIPTGSTSPEISVSYPTNLQNQSINFVYSNRNTYRNGVLTLMPSYVTIRVDADTGYTAGTISINGVDTGESEVYNEIFSDGDVITVSEAEETSEYILDTVMTVGQGSSIYGYNLSGGYGSLGDDQLVVGSSTYTVTSFYVKWGKIIPKLTVSLDSSIEISATVCIGDSSTSKYWEVSVDSFPYEENVGVQTAAGNLYSYLQTCYQNETSVPIKIVLT